MRAALVDTSRWQGSVNVQKIKDAGFCGLITRATIGWSYLDPLYLNIAAQAREIEGFIFGAYHVLWPKNKNPKREVAWFQQNVIDVDLTILDVELLHGLTLSQVQAQAKIWLDDMAQIQKPLLYTGSWFWKKAAGWEDDYDLWEAEYTISQPRGGIDKSQQPDSGDPRFVGWTDWKMWQWTSGGKPIGIASQSLDYNVFNGDEAELRQYLELAEPPLSDKQKLDLLWEAHPELHD
jgi:GH25 family lysozyme M1 (1,4-beta-N-acetylmuramidase)